MYFFGLKLWSTNQNYISHAVRLYQEEIFHYIELYTVPGSYDDFHILWKDVGIPFIIHGPHFKDGLNFARQEDKKGNFLMAHEALRFADSVQAGIVIFHPGVNGDIKETARQIKELNDKRIIIENKPYYGLGENLICNGSSPEDILYIMEETGAGFCLDIGHAICAANAIDHNPIEYLEKFIELKPKMYHLTDGDYYGLYDRHDHYGQGSFPLERLLQLIPADSHVTNEAVKDSPENLDDFVRDMKLLNKLLKKKD